MSARCTHRAEKSSNRTLLVSSSTVSSCHVSFLAFSFSKMFSLALVTLEQPQAAMVLNFKSTLPSAPSPQTAIDCKFWSVAWSRQQCWEFSSHFTIASPVAASHLSVNWEKAQLHGIPKPHEPLWFTTTTTPGFQPVVSLHSCVDSIPEIFSKWAD